MLARGGERGFYLIGLLIVLAIIAILTTTGYFGSSKNGPGTYKTSTDKADKVACESNRSTIEANVQMWRIDHPDAELTVENLESSTPPVEVPACPGGGAISFGPNGEVYCSLHNPPPEGS